MASIELAGGLLNDVSRLAKHLITTTATHLHTFFETSVNPIEHNFVHGAAYFVLKVLEEDIGLFQMRVRCSCPRNAWGKVTRAQQKGMDNASQLGKEDGCHC